jgi:Immunoglobulin-like domain of bacterial spore germination/Sporulation and spore germination
MRRAAVVVLLGALVAGCSGAMTGSPSAAPTPSAPTPGAAGRAQALPAYFVATTAAGMRLQREFHRVTTTDPASDAVREMVAAPTDPDYRTLWPSGTSLRSPVKVDGGAIVVDLTGPTTPGEMALQQLVFTVQGALQSTLPVQLMIDGTAVGRPVPRGDDYAVRSLVQIDSPADGASVGREVVVQGEACVFEATLPWEVRRDGAVVKSGVAATSEGQRFAAYSFTVTLEPGTYEIRVTEDDPSAGEGRPVMSDTKTVTVG